MSQETLGKKDIHNAKKSAQSFQIENKESFPGFSSKIEIIIKDVTRFFPPAAYAVKLS